MSEFLSEIITLRNEALKQYNTKYEVAKGELRKEVMKNPMHTCYIVHTEDTTINLLEFSRKFS